MKKILTEELIEEKYSYSSKKIADIQLINFWGIDIEDISILNKCTNLITLCLSCNNISDISVLRNCPNLKELYLRKNNIKELNQVLYLEKLQGLSILWLNDNPISQIENYRNFVEKHLPQVKNLDKFPTVNYFCQFVNIEDRQLIITIMSSYKNKNSKNKSSTKINLLFEYNKDVEKKPILKIIDRYDKNILLPRRSISNSNVLAFLSRNPNNQKITNEASHNDSKLKNILWTAEKINKNIVDNDELKISNNNQSNIFGKYNDNLKSKMNFMNFDFKSCKNVLKQYN